MRKGISPVVAAVLLIAAAIVIGVLVSTWASDWVNYELMDTDIGCSIDTNYVIESAQYNATGFLGQLLIKLTNKGSKAIYGFGAVIDNGTHIVELNSTSAYISQGGINAGTKLAREKSAYISIDLYSAGNVSFAESLPLSDTISIKVTNTVCPAVAAKTDSITTG